MSTHLKNLQYEDKFLVTCQMSQKINKYKHDYEIIKADLFNYYN